jgi:hypothetical protein
MSQIEWVVLAVELAVLPPFFWWLTGTLLTRMGWPDDVDWSGPWTAPAIWLDAREWPFTQAEADAIADAVARAGGTPEIADDVARTVVLTGRSTDEVLGGFVRMFPEDS